MSNRKSIELLSPARNLECGIEAICHGADAVYIGASRFGARAAAGNSIEDIAALVRYAHPFGVKIYVTLNTLLFDDELPAVDALIEELQAANVDALIVQDPRLMALNRGRIPLHSSTQMDNRTIADVRSRLDAGYTQTVLARELSLDAIRAIHAAVPEMPLEVFVHGALCVSYSGRCYASEHCFGRSANRGECAQFCRLPFDLLDADGRIVTVLEGSSVSSSRAPEGSSPKGSSSEGLRQLHLLSLRDMNRAADIEALMDAGASSFKIEGRLKDVSYVKNTTAFYRQQIDEIIARRPDDFCRSSFGISTISFTPNLNKSFNRRFTDYFLHGRTPDMACFSTPKAIGEPVGHVKSTMPLAIAGSASFSNGDGLCFFDDEGHLQGFRVNRVDEHGYLYPADVSILGLLRKGTPLYRNYDAAFERLLSRPTADRRVPVIWLLEDTPDGFRVTLKIKDVRLEMIDSQVQPSLRSTFVAPHLENPLHSSSATYHSSLFTLHSSLFTYPHELARTPQADNIRRQLSRLGDTPYTTTDADIIIRFSDNWFIPSSILADWRREVMNSLIAASYSPPVYSPPALPALEGSSVSSSRAREGAITLEDSKADACSEHPTPPLTGRDGVGLLMTCRYCIRHALGFCPRDHADASQDAPRQPWLLRLADGRTFPLRFDCQRCEMLVLSKS